MKRFQSLPIIMCMILTLALSGCSIPLPMELSRRLIIEAVGVDTEKNGVKITLQTVDAFFGEQGKEGGDKKGSTEIYGFQGQNAAEALAKVEETTGLKPMFSQIKLIVLSEETARKGVKEILEYFLNETRLRPDIDVCVSEGKAQDVVAAKLGSSAGAAGVLQETLRAAAKTGRTVRTLLFRFMSLLYSEIDTPLCPVISVRKSDVSDSLLPALTGAALFDGDVLRKKIGEEETQLLAFLTGGAKKTEMTVSLENGDLVSALFLSPRVQRKLICQNSTFSAVLTLRAVCSVSQKSQKNNASTEALLAQIRKQLSTRLRLCFQSLCADAGFDFCRLKKRCAQKYPSFSAEKDGEALLKNVIIQLEIKQK
ncbi:MAG: hypothetical protein IJT27_08645 [Clostridia bacterium]|nr:hypothetical protein [Clostridia bacterium]